MFPSAQSISISGTVSTLSTLTSMSQKGGIDLQQTEMRWEMRNKWNLAVRSRITWILVPVYHPNHY